MELCEIGRELHEIHERADFVSFYERRGIVEIEDKIRCLRKVLKILASRSDEADTPEEELMGLEDFVMSHLWEAFE